MIDRRTLAVLTALAVAAVAACGPAASPSPTRESLEAVADFTIDGTWQRCHQIGGCEYHLELDGPDGIRTAELVRLSAQGDSGTFAPDEGFPARLVAGEHTLTLVSTMFGDTIEPNGSVTMLGEEARCEADFTVDEKTTIVQAKFAFVPGRCTLEIIKGELTN